VQQHTDLWLAGVWGLPPTMEAKLTRAIEMQLQRMGPSQSVSEASEALEQDGENGDDYYLSD
jgi:hypothetical protein